MQVAGIPRPAAELEGDAVGLFRGCQARENRRGSALAELGGVVLALVNAGVPRGGRVQVEGVPGEGKGVGWVYGFVGCDGPGETAVADVAPLSPGGLDLGIEVNYLGTYRTDGVGDDLDVDVGHDVRNVRSAAAPAV